MGMMSRHKQGQDSEARPGRLGSLLGPAAFVPFFVLPLIYFGHLTNSSPPAVSPDLKTGAAIMESRTEAPAPFQESNACPICQGASSFQDYGIPEACHAPDGSALLGPRSEGSGSSGLSRTDGLSLQSRAPPVMSLAKPPRNLNYLNLLTARETRTDPEAHRGAGDPETGRFSLT